MKNNKNVIRLTEEDLNNIIKESVQQILKENPENEGLWDYFKSMGRQGSNKAQQIGQAAGEKAKQGYNAVADKAKQGYNAVADKVKQGYNYGKGVANNTVQGVKTMHQNAQSDAAMQDISKAVKILQNAMAKNPASRQRLGSIVKQLSNLQGNYQMH